MVFWYIEYNIYPDYKKYKFNLTGIYSILFIVTFTEIYYFNFRYLIVAINKINSILYCNKFNHRLSVNLKILTKKMLFKLFHIITNINLNNLFQIIGKF